MEPRYRCLDVSAFPAGEGMALCTSRGGARGHLLSMEDAQLLDRCRPFRTLREHAAALAGDGDGDAAAALLPRLAALQAAGLLLSEGDVAERLSAARAPAPPQIGAVGVVTKDRLPSLLRCLESLCDDLDRAGRRPEVLVMDDTPSPEARRAARGALRELGRRRGARLRYAGPKDKAAYAARLARRAAVPEAVARFGLRDDLSLSRACGANHNALLLDQAGAMFLGLDDDVLCRAVRLSEPRRALRLCSAPDPTQFAFFRDAEETRARTRDVPLDLLGEHERVLGRGLGDLVDSAAGSLDLDGLEAPFLLQLTARARVRLSSLGLCGDSGMGSPAAYLRLQGDSRARLLRSEADYRAYCRSRQVLRGATAVTVTDSAFLMAPVVGHDARTILPPYYPVLRNNDGVFGAALRLALPDGYIAHLPYALRHEPPEPRSEQGDAVHRGAGQISGFDVILCCLASLRPPARQAGPEGHRLRALGERLEVLGVLPPPEFEAELLPLLLRLAATRAEEIARCLAAHGEAPAYWAADLRRQLAALREGAAQPGYLVPADLRPGRRTKEARTLSQELVRRYGELLSAWPALFAAAAALRREGDRPSRPIDDIGDDEA